MVPRSRFIVGALLLFEVIAFLLELRQLRQWRTVSELAKQAGIVARETKRMADQGERLAGTRLRTGIRMGGSMWVLEGPELAVVKQTEAEMGSPEHAHLRQIEEVAELSIRYGPFFRSQRLDADQIAKLLALLSNQENLPRDMNKTAADQHIGIDDFRKAMAAAKGELETGMKDVLGAEKYSQLADYRAQLGAHLCVSQLQQELGVNADHLSDVQAEALTKILIGNSPAPLTGPWVNSMIPFLAPTWYRGDAYNSGLPPGGQPNIIDGSYRFVMRSASEGYIGSQGNIDSVYTATDAAMTAAAGLLTPAQLSTFAAIRQKEMGEREMADNHFDSAWSRRKPQGP